MALETADDSFAGGNNTTAGGGGKPMNPNDAGVMIPLDLPLIKLELSKKAAECQQRGLAHSYKWLAEISYALRYESTIHVQEDFSF